MQTESVAPLSWHGRKTKEIKLITSNRLIRYVGAEPFRPFRITMASGETFEIRHPEMVNVGRSTAYIYTDMDDEAVHSNQREREVSLLLMESVEPLNATSIQDGTK